MSWILGIDTSSAELSIGLIHSRKPYTSFSRYVPNSHAEHITSTINFILESNEINAAEISHAGIAVGPGSFTGLRIGISFLKGFFLKRETPILPVSSLQSMAGAFHSADCSVVSAMDARQGRVFCAEFKRENKICKRVSDDVLLSADDFSTITEKKSVLLFDTLGYSKSTVFNSLKDRKNAFSTDEITLQRGLACAQIAANSVNDSSLWKKSIDILPNYMQPSYAEKKCSNKAE
jgi:tRNA threonylcarbamoyladenosine biosynthesis protein TsaB